MPLMKPAILVALLFRTLDAFRVFDTVFILTARRQRHRDGLDPRLQRADHRLNLGLGSAVSVLIFICVILIAVALREGPRHLAPRSSEGR